MIVNLSAVTDDCVAENFGEARRRRAALTVLLISMVMVLGRRRRERSESAGDLIAAGWTSPTGAAFGTEFLEAV